MAHLGRFLTERGYIHKVNPAIRLKCMVVRSCQMDADNRNVQFEFKCPGRGFEMNADIDAGTNIWTSRMTYINGLAAHLRLVLIRKARLRVVKRQNEPCCVQFDV